MLRCPGRHPNETHKQLFPRPVLLLCLLTFTGLFAACKIIISVPPAGTLAPPVADDAPATKAPSTTEAATDEAAPEVRGTGVVSFCLTVTDLEKKTK